MIKETTKKQTEIKRNNKEIKRSKKKQEKIYPSINIIFTFISIKKNNNFFDIFRNCFDIFIEQIIIEYDG